MDILIATKKGKVIRADIDTFPILGRATQGVRGIKLEGEDEVADIAFADEEDTLLIAVTNKGKLIRTRLDSIKQQERGGSGCILGKLLAGDEIKNIEVTCPNW